MPKQLERRLMAIARRRHYTGARFRRYVYGTLAKIKRAHLAQLRRRR